MAPKGFTIVAWTANLAFSCERRSPGCHLESLPHLVLLLTFNWKIGSSRVARLLTQKTAKNRIFFLSLLHPTRTYLECVWGEMWSPGFWLSRFWYQFFSLLRQILWGFFSFLSFGNRRRKSRNNIWVFFAILQSGSGPGITQKYPIRQTFSSRRRNCTLCRRLNAKFF